MYGKLKGTINNMKKFFFYVYVSITLLLFAGCIYGTVLYWKRAHGLLEVRFSLAAVNHMSLGGVRMAFYDGVPEQALRELLRKTEEGRNMGEIIAEIIKLNQDVSKFNEEEKE